MAIVPNNNASATAVALAIPPIVTTNTAVTNPNNFPVNVTLTGGSGVSVVKVNSVQAGTAVGTYTVPGGGTLSVTFSTTAPTVSATTPTGITQPNAYPFTSPEFQNFNVQQYAGWASTGVSGNQIYT